MFSVNPGYHPPRDPDPAGLARPRVIAAYQILDGPDTRFAWPAGVNVVKARDADTARAAVRKLKERGNDFVKVYSRLPREAYFAAVAEAKALGLPVAGHLPYEVTAAEASDAGQLSIEHLDGVAVGCSSREARLTAMLRDLARPGKKVGLTGGARWKVYVEAYESYDPDRAAALFRKFVANGTWHVPTLVQTRALSRLGDEAALDPEVERQLPPLVAGFWKREITPDGVRLPKLGLKLTAAEVADARVLFREDLKLVGRMHRAGVPLLAGTDAPFPLVVPGNSLHEELALLVEAGLSPAAALRAATLNPAQCLGREADLGAVEPGKLADLVLLARNPLADIHNTQAVAAVLVGGRVAWSDNPATGSAAPVETRR
jgi:hypothetical protein